MPNPLPTREALINKVKRELDALIEARNRCAHNGANAPVPALSDLVSYIATVRAVAEAINKVMEAQFKTYQLPP